MLVLTVSLTACKREPRPRRTVAAARQLPAHPATGRDALVERCRQLAAPAAGKTTDPSVDPDSVPLPPSADDESCDPAERRLAALRAIDELTGLLRRSPAHPEVHFRVGWVYLYALENPRAAVPHLCRAMLGAAGEPKYKLTLYSAWMTPGHEEELELSLRASDLTLPWRAALEEARQLRGLDRIERARAFVEAIRAQRIIRTSRALRRQRTTARVVDLPVVLAEWSNGGPPDDLHVVLSFPRRLRARASTLRYRGGEKYRLLWGAPGPGGRWLVYGYTPEAIDAALKFARDRLPGKRVGISLEQGTRKLYLICEPRKAGFAVLWYGGKPEVSEIRGILGLDHPPGAP